MKFLAILHLRKILSSAKTKSTEAVNYRFCFVKMHCKCYIILVNQTNSKENSLQKHVHIIGICGVLTSALACAFKDAGWKVTGSDKGFFPPASTQLERLGVEFYAGWHPEKLAEIIQTQCHNPDLAIAATASGTKNPEVLYMHEQGIKTISSTEAIRDYLVRDNSIVVAGTWGKTTSSTLLSHILIEAGLDPSYMFGGISLSHNMSARIRQSKWSVLEGDEYKSSPEDSTAKFFYYNPTHLLLTAVSWDHADLYPTPQSYFDTFEKLIDDTFTRIKAGGRGNIVACSDNLNLINLLKKVSTEKQTSYVAYGSKTGDCTYSEPQVSNKGLSFTITKTQTGERFSIKSQLLGSYNAENITGCFAMAYEIGIKPDEIIKAIASFKGLKRRMEKRLDGQVVIIDDIAHSPEKASYILENLRNIYKTSKIIAIFEPNIGGRRLESANKYDSAFKYADLVYIPRLTKLKVSGDESPESKSAIEGDELARIISQTHKNTFYIEDDAQIVEKIATEVRKGDVVAFLGSHGFRGMIEETAKRLADL